MRKIYTIFLFLLVLATGSTAQENIPAAEITPSPRVRFYPNPATSEINFEFEKGYDNTYTFDIFNFLGKKVYEISKVTQRNTVYLNDFYRGIYIFQLKDKDGRILESGKFQVVK